MDHVHEGLQRAAAEHTTRPIPKTVAAQMRFLLKREKGSTRAVATRLGCSQRQVERYLAGTARHPRPQLAQALKREVTKDWQPRLKARARKQAATTGGLTIETRARFGFTAAGGSTDQARIRRITQHLPPTYAARLFAAQAAGASEQHLQTVIAEGLQEVYFKAGGTRAPGLEVEFTDIDYIDIAYS